MARQKISIVTKPLRLLLAGVVLLALAGGTPQAQAAEVRQPLHEADRLVLEQRMGCNRFVVADIAPGVQRITCAEE
jgi:hypothetical protein